MLKIESLVYITGSGRSGSTLLDMLLSTHPDIAALGEVHRFSMNLGMEAVPYQCTCGEAIENCMFWRAVLDQIRSDNLDPYILKTTWRINESIGVDQDGTNIVENVPSKSFLDSKINIFNVFLSFGMRKLILMLSPLVLNFREGLKIANDSWYLYEKVCEAHNKKIAVDGTKTPGRLLALMAFNRYQTPVKVIYLCRDGRAVTHARMKRQGLNMNDAVKIWVMEHKKISIALKRYKDNIPLFIRYEDLCAETGIIMRKVFSYIGVRDLAQNESFRDSSHSLGGNPMRLRRSETKIVINEKWKSELSQEELDEFEKIGGKLNRELGYE